MKRTQKQLMLRLEAYNMRELDLTVEHRSRSTYPYKFTNLAGTKNVSDWCKLSEAHIFLDGIDYTLEKLTIYEF